MPLYLQFAGAAGDADNPLDTVICNGMWGGLIEPFRKRFNLRHVIEIYGTTEGVGSFINHEEVLDKCGNLTLGGMRQGEVARCNFDTGELMRDDNGRVLKCEPGRVGVLLCEINDLNPFTGYINDEEATQAKIVKNAFQDGDEYFNTYDLVELDEGEYISFVDRLGDAYRWKGKTVSAHQVADVIMKYFGPIEDATVYGVKIPGFEGRCGMAAIKFLEGEKMEWPKFLQYLNNRMPEHARPLFFRVIDQIEGDELLEDWKMNFKKDGFSPEVVKDPMFYLDPVKKAIMPLTPEVYKDIVDNKIQF
ncbi:AMP-binding protein [Syntrophomonas palmitatica]|uniref:AMP-binding protein n=1 Tax=Syntrophomonas palmitatica TaxID=402877 RepID=UPI0006D2674E|nr:AMP-binding protein [Syntrophomonas palmitatica]